MSGAEGGKRHEVACQDNTEPPAAYAGTAFDPKGGVPCITALALDQEGEYETTEYDTDKTYVAGAPLKVVAGKLTLAASEDEAVGYVTRPATERWINNAIAVPTNGTDQRLAVRTGANKFVLRFRTK